MGQGHGSTRRLTAQERTQRQQITRSATAAAATRLRASAPPSAHFFSVPPSVPPSAPPATVSAPTFAQTALALRARESEISQLSQMLQRSHGNVLRIAADQLDRGDREFTKADLVAIAACLHRVTLSDARVAHLATLTCPELRAHIRLVVFEEPLRTSVDVSSSGISASASGSASGAVLLELSEQVPEVHEEVSDEVPETATNTANKRNETNKTNEESERQTNELDPS